MIKERVHRLPGHDYNIVWHPGVYLFLGNDAVYRVGMQHMTDRTSDNGHSIWDIEKFQDKSILLFNVKEKKDRFWLLGLEAYFENKFSPLISPIIIPAFILNNCLFKLKVG